MMHSRYLNTDMKSTVRIICIRNNNSETYGQELKTLLLCVRKFNKDQLVIIVKRTTMEIIF